MIDWPIPALENMATSESATVSRLHMGGETNRGGKTMEKEQEQKREAKNYRGFVAGVFSGVSKLTGKVN